MTHYCFSRCNSLKDVLRYYSPPEGLIHITGPFTPSRLARLTSIARIGSRDLVYKPTAPVRNPNVVTVRNEVSEEESDATGVSKAVGDAADHLFDLHHIPSWTPSLLLYAPVGLLVAVCRMALWILGIALDAPWFRHPAVVATYLRLLGVRCNWHHLERLPAGAGSEKRCFPQEASSTS